MAFGREVHDRVDAALRASSSSIRAAVADVGLDEAVIGPSGNLTQRIEIAGVGQLVDIDDAIAPLPARSRTTALPMKPAPPVTRIRSFSSEARFRRRPATARRDPCRKGSSASAAIGHSMPMCGIVEADRAVVLAAVGRASPYTELRCPARASQSHGRSRLGTSIWFHSAADKRDADPLADRSASPADVDGDVEYRPARDPHQFVLGHWRRLEMQAAQHARHRATANDCPGRTSRRCRLRAKPARSTFPRRSRGRRANCAGRSSSTPSGRAGGRSSKTDLACPAAQIVGIIGLAELVGARPHLVRRQIAELQRDFLQAHDLQALPLLDRAHVRRGVVKAVMSAGVEPGKAAAKARDAEVAALKVGAIDVGDLQLAAGRWLEAARRSSSTSLS